MFTFITRIIQRLIGSTQNPSLKHTAATDYKSQLSATGSNTHEQVRLGKATFYNDEYESRKAFGHLE